jgi:probable rRNA maturation factor
MAAPRTMILLDPDLDPAPPPPAKVLRRPADSAQVTGARNKRIPNTRTLAHFLRAAQAAVKLRGQVTILLTTDTAIRRLNRQFRGKNKATDVLSFPSAALPLVSKARPGAPRIQEVAGDVAISIPTARQQAEDRGHSLAMEIKVLMLHGLLHLAGYDHELDAGQMARREQKLRGSLRLPHGLIERTLNGATKAGASSLPQAHRSKGGIPRTPKGPRR